MNRRLRVVVISMLCLLAPALCAAAGANAQKHAPASVNRLSDGDLLFLEALRRGYEMDDAVVRRELQLRMLDALVREHPLPEPDNAALAAYLDAHAARYQLPARYSFEQVYLSRGGRGAALQKAADEVAARLRRDPENYAGLGDPFPRGQKLSGLSQVQIEADFGQALAEQIPSLPQGQWRGPLASPLGLHCVRVTAVEPARTPALAAIRQRVTIDYREAQKQRIVREALARLRRKYAGSAPPPRPAASQEEEIP